MSSAFTFRINNQQLKLALGRWKERIGPGPLLRVAAQVMMGSIEQTFRDQGSPAGSWPALSPSTLGMTGSVRGKRFRKAFAAELKRGLRGGPGRMILINKGRLKKSITSEIQGNRLIIGSNLVYARIHQLGGMAGRGRKVRIPARPYLVFRPEDPERMQKAMDRVIQEFAKAEGL